MGNGNGSQQKHVSFEKSGGDGTQRSNNRGSNHERSFDSRDSYDAAPQMRSRESTFSLGQKIQEKAQTDRIVDTAEEVFEDRRFQGRAPLERMDIASSDRWNDRQEGGTTTTTTTKQEWQREYDDDKDPDYIDEDEDWRRKKRFPAQRTAYISTNRRSRPIEETWQQTPRGEYQQRPKQGADYPNARSPSRAFNTRDSDDPWYNDKEVLNKRADWALVGRHVISRPISARPIRTGERDFRRLRDDIDTFSDPTAYGSSGVRPTHIPRIPRTPRSVYTYEDHWKKDSNTGTRRPTLNTYYKTYSVNSYR